MTRNKALEKALPWFDYLLSDYNFKVLDTVDLENFGDSYAITESPSFRLRFILERNKPFVEMASLHNPNDWHDVALVRVLFDPNLEYEYTNLEVLAVFIDENFSELAMLFSKKNLEKTEFALKEAKKKYLEKKFPNWFSKE